MYQVASSKAEEFIHDGEIVETLAYARENRANRPLIEAILQKSGRRQRGHAPRSGRAARVRTRRPEPTHVHAGQTDQGENLRQPYRNVRAALSVELLHQRLRILPVSPENKTIPRRKLTQDEIRREVIALQDMGHKRLAIEAGEDPIHNPLSYILESLETIYGTKHKNGAIRRVNANIAATTEDAYRQLKAAEIGTYILFQETYHKESYEKLHPTGPKHNYAYHTEAMDRAMEAVSMTLVWACCSAWKSTDTNLPVC